MNTDARKYYLAEIKRFAEKVNGFPPKAIAIDYWEGLSNQTLLAVYYKWKDLSEIQDSELI